MITLPDGRLVPSPLADERAMLESWLDFHRETLLLKCRGLEDAQVRRASMGPSDMTLLGLVQHMADVERNWFRMVFAEEELPRLFPEGDGFGLAPERGMAEVLEAWRAEVARSRELSAGAGSLDDRGRLPAEAVGMLGESVSLRWILVHMIEEYARHNGHADLLREGLDGVTGA